jgi:hypothetical protein
MSLNLSEVYLYVEPTWFYQQQRASISEYISSKIPNPFRVKRLVSFNEQNRTNVNFNERDNEYFASTEVKKFPYSEVIALRLLENDLNENVNIQFHVYLRDASIAQSLQRAFPNVVIIPFE